MVLPFLGITRILFQNGRSQKNSLKSPFLPQFLLSCEANSINYKLGGTKIFNCPKSKFIVQILPAPIQKLLKFAIVNQLKKISIMKKGDSINLVKNCLAQFEFVIAHRIRRGQQIFNLYSKLWDEVALKQFLMKMKKQFMKRGKDVLLSVVAMSVFNWDLERITDEEISRHGDEFELCHKLKSALDKSSGVQKKAKDVKSTCCGDSLTATGNFWHPFINDGNLIVWKMEEERYKGSGLYCYKMFGRYDDVTAKDFFLAFLDTDTRKEWDKHVVSLYVIESEPPTNSDIIYWETKWPTLFSNRDYVYKRRYKIDRAKKLITIVNKSTEHPNIPLFNNKTRVNEYWSFMVIRPLNDDFKKPGIEFSLTYFDNPGTSLPNTICHWVSATGMPQYLKQLRFAALEISKKGRPFNDDEQPVGPNVDVSGAKVSLDENEGDERKEDKGGEKHNGRKKEIDPSLVPSSPGQDVVNPVSSPTASLPSNDEKLSPLAIYIHWALSYLI